MNKRTKLSILIAIAGILTVACNLATEEPVNNSSVLQPTPNIENPDNGILNDERTNGAIPLSVYDREPVMNGRYVKGEIKCLIPPGGKFYIKGWIRVDIHSWLGGPKTEWWAYVYDFNSCSGGYAKIGP